MIIWLNGTHGVGKTTTAALVQQLIPSKGYGGGAIERPGADVPELAKYERIPDIEADALAADLHDMYERLGFSIRDIAAETGFSITRVRALLDRAGADIRPRGAVAVSS
ncbi:helix-turn-helix domain-containing protein [Cryobacterium sp. M15]|jgi:hypothetical protein|uniref:helix-turn-helix domain-containing protein n=1 Tax=Cryobacterium sp. M15 TaxID=2048291 RepID=UPI001E5C209B|nr:helix-turn-helix domain-containing protein [Cryobacterium sp. M15]